MKAIQNFWKNKALRNWSLVIFALIIIFFVVRGYLPANRNNASFPTTAQVVTVEVAETIETSGALQAQPFASLAWKTSGVVETINVKPGDFVKTGDILLALQPESTSGSIVSGQADLVNAQETLKELLDSDTALIEAEQAVHDAEEDYAKAYNWRTQLNGKVDIKEYIYDQFGKLRLKEYKGYAGKETIEQADRDLALAESKLGDARREYERLLQGEDSAEVAAAKASVEAAQATVNSLYLLAPFDGQILSLDNRVGDSVESGEISVNIADLTNLYVDAQIDESDIANVKLGNHAEITLDAANGAVFTGQVSAINPVGETVSNVVKYTVRVDLDSLDEDIFLPLGATANVVIQVKEAEPTLAVPIIAIQNDAKSEYVLVVESNGSTRRVNVTGGAIIGDLVAITGDLKEGDRISTVISADENNSQGPGGFGGQP
jgi:RND family efflux transporter MFP subunit